MLKRDLRLFLRCLTAAFLWFVILAAVCLVSAGALIGSSGTSFTAAKIAVVDEEDSALSRILLRSVSNLEAMKGLIETESMSKDEAMAALSAEDYAAVVELPTGFFDAVMSGKEIHGKIYLSKAAVSHTPVVEGIAKFAERILVAGQYGVFVGEELILDRELGGTAHNDFLNEVNPALLSEAMGAFNRYFSFEVLDYSGSGVSMTAHYLICWSLMLLFLISLFFIPLVTEDSSRSVLSRLSAYGVTPVRFISGKFLVLTVFRTLLMGAALLIMGQSEEISLTVWAVPMILVVSAFVTLIGICLILCMGDPISWTLIQAAGGLFFCGGLVPRQLLPLWLTTVGDYTPFGAAKALAAPIFGGSLSVGGVIAAVIYVLAAMFLICRKFRRIIEGGRQL